MSGGHFDYSQYKITEIAEEVERIISFNEVAGEPYYTKATLAKFKKAVRTLRKAAIYAQRIDWLVSCDDGEEQFHERLKEELDKLK